jgi:hypothetical protein
LRVASFSREAPVLSAKDVTPGRLRLSMAAKMDARVASIPDVLAVVGLTGNLRPKGWHLARAAQLLRLKTY